MMDFKNALLETYGNMTQTDAMLKNSGDDPAEPEAEYV